MKAERQRFVENLMAQRELEEHKANMHKWWPIQLAPTPIRELSQATNALNVFLFDGGQNQNIWNEVIHAKVIPFLGGQLSADIRYPQITPYHVPHKESPCSQERVTNLWNELRYENCVVFQVEALQGTFRNPATGEDTKAITAHRVYCDFWLDGSAPKRLGQYPLHISYVTNNANAQNDWLAQELNRCILFLADMVAFLQNPLDPPIPRTYTAFEKGFLDTEQGAGLLTLLRRHQSALLPVYQEVPQKGLDFSLRITQALLDNEQTKAAQQHLLAAIFWAAGEVEADIMVKTPQDVASTLRKLQLVQRGNVGRKTLEKLLTLLIKAGYVLPEISPTAIPIDNYEQWVEEVL